MHAGTSTAGLTAPKQNPKAHASNHGKSKINLETFPSEIFLHRWKKCFNRDVHTYDRKQ